MITEAETKPPEGPPAPTAYGWCSWHRGISEDVRLIQVQEAGSGPCTVGNRFACARCRRRFRLVPLADRS